MAAAFVPLFQNERAIRRERIFRDRTQNLDTLSDSELLADIDFQDRASSLYRIYLLLYYRDQQQDQNLSQIQIQVIHINIYLNNSNLINK